MVSHVCRWLLCGPALVILSLAVGCAVRPPSGSPRWWKGNLHTHTLWSDGDQYPELVAAWYKDRGYHFLALTDHNLMQRGERWVEVTAARGGEKAVRDCQTRFGPGWVERRQKAGRTEVRLKTYEEFESHLAEPGAFLLMPAEEITDRHLTAPLHLNGTNLREPITAQGGSNVVEVLQRNVDAVLAQRQATGQPMFPHVNHPNFGWGITAEELMQVQGERFFEVYNGHPSVNNEGDAGHPGTERMWDIVLTWRLAVLNLGPMWGLATDDSHHYHTNAVALSNSGRGWVQVQSRELTPASLIAALEAGDFYASSGVELREVQRDPRRLRVVVEPRPGTTYRVEFIGTRRGFNRESQTLTAGNGLPLRVTRRYSPEVGAVLATVDGPVAEYPLQGDEIYVRARITSSRRKDNPGQAGEYERAWTQPVCLVHP